MQTTGILGGTFDPVHNAHLALARAALAHLGLERILWMPTGAPRYRAPAKAPAQHRVAMLKLALAGEPRYAIDERELDSGHSGYTIDTLESLGGKPVLLMGADQYAKLQTWHRWREILDRASIAVFARPGAAVPAAGVRSVPFEPLDISASDIRARLARGADVSALVPPAVLDYIRRHGLYR
ncbi:MAG: nicotinate (nicotinamide) nucleotide adenylyltransferase [Betaproteobacteria bacterium]|nr:nicotinate (nicotinamide) nucleotide adenylyltransferase [Betaproteobacteria bacterium]